VDYACEGRTETMVLKSEHFKQYFTWLVVGLLYIFLIHPSSVECVTASSIEAKSHILDHDLRLARVIEVNQQIMTINLQSYPLYLTESSYMTFALFEVENAGDELKKITIILSARGYEWEELFQRKEALVDYCYDFTELTELYVPLEGIDNLPPPLTLQIFLILEYYPQLSDTSARFSLLKTILRQIRSVPESDLLIFPTEFNLNFPNHTYSFETAHFILTSYYLTNITASERLSALIELKTEVSVRVLESSEITQINNAGNLTSFQVVMITNLTKRRVSLEVQGMISGHSYPVTLKLHSTEIQQQNHSIFQGSLPAHPIPSWLMMPFWLIFLFGVPIIYLFRQEDESIK